MEKYEVIIKELNNNNELSLALEANEVETMENIIIQASVSEQQITSINYNYFSAYQKFRDQLLQLGYGIKCNGSRINAVQSDMMVATDKIYLVELGKQALMKDVVSICNPVYKFLVHYQLNVRIIERTFYGFFGKLKKNHNFSPKRKPIPKIPPKTSWHILRTNQYPHKPNQILP